MSLIVPSSHTMMIKHKSSMKNVSELDNEESNSGIPQLKTLVSKKDSKELKIDQS